MQEMVSASVEYVNVTPISLAVLVIALWISLHVWLPMGKSAMEEEPVSVEPVTAQMPNSKAPRVKCVRPALVSVQSTSKCQFNKGEAFRDAVCMCIFGIYIFSTLKRRALYIHCCFILIFRSEI